MSGLKDVLKVEGEISIKVVDKKTNKVVKEVKEKNVVLSGFASGVCGELAGETDTRLGVIDTVYLYDSGDNLIKYLGETERTDLVHHTYTDHDDVYVKFEDTSTDTYTVARADLETGYNGYSRLICRKTGLSVSKASDQKLIVEWTIKVYFGA